MKKSRIFVAIFLLVLSMCIIAPDGAMANPELDWPGLYDPFTMLTFNLVMDPSDWTRIVNDDTYDIEVPALFWATEDGNDPPILVSVRRKSATMLGKDKISLKIDINEYTVEDVCDDNYGFTDPTCVEKWHGVKKMSIENGDDVNVVAEGFAWYLHRVASEFGLDYTTGYASWVTLYVNYKYKGVYVNVEQPDKQFLKNHKLWEGSDETWLYKGDDIGKPEIKEAPEDENGDPIDSPTYELLCYEPFRTKRACKQPKEFKEELSYYINMEGMLTLGAVSAFHNSPDDLFSKGKNFYFVDYLDFEDSKREYTQWDLDSAFSSYNATTSIYNQGKGKSTNDIYEKNLVESSDSPFRAEYDEIMWELLDGPFLKKNLHDTLNRIEVEIGLALEADPNNNLSDGPAGEFARLRSFISDRIDNVRYQLQKK